MARDSIEQPSHRNLVVAIVGGGAFCTYALERLAAEVHARAGRAGLDVHIFNKSPTFGSGMAQARDQAPTSLMNRVASQIALAADESNQDAIHLLPAELRPTFLQWADRRFLATRNKRYRLDPTEVPARAVHGEALSEAFRAYINHLKSVRGVQTWLHREMVEAIRREAGRRFRIHGSEGSIVIADNILLVTGHPDNRPGARSDVEWLAEASAREPAISFLGQVYPLQSCLTADAVPPGVALGLIGMGLGAIDAILFLTEGRGGRFEEDRGGRLRYVRSGAEPGLIVPIAPSGIFPGTRPYNEKAVEPSARGHSALEHQPVCLTREAIRLLRNRVGRPNTLSSGHIRQLDFRLHVFPLLVLEMALISYRTQLGAADSRQLTAIARSAAEAFVLGNADTHPTDPDELLGALHGAALARGLAPFDWRVLFNPALDADTADPARFRRWMLRFLEDDIAAAQEGNLSNPAKAACDGGWRDLRSILSEVVDFGGLTAQSQREFMQVYWRYYCRMSNGASVDAMRRIFALCRDGLVDPGIGPKPAIARAETGDSFILRGGLTGAERRVGIIADSRVHDFCAPFDRCPLYRNLISDGLVRLWRNPGTDGAEDFVPGSLDVNSDFHPVRADGTVDQDMTILGVPVEGTAFFQLAAARPQSNSPLINACARWAAAVADRIEDRDPSPAECDAGARAV